MLNLFDAATRSSLLARLDRLEVGSARQWGTMSPAQMCAHCSAAFEVATGDTPRKQALLGKLVAWTVRGKFLGDAPFPRNSPTDPTFVIRDPRELAVERLRLTEQVALFVARGPEAAASRPHTFFGRLSGEQWGVVMAKHLDHHLRQFGV